MKQGKQPLVAALRLIRAAKHRLNFMLYHALDGGTRGAQVLPWVEVAGVFSQVAAQRGGECNAHVAVDIHFAHSTTCGLAQHIFGDADGVVEPAAELVDLRHEVLRD